MIKHCVFIRFKAEITENQRNTLYQSIHELRHHLPGWLNFVAGANVTIEAGMDKGFNGGFIIDLADTTARDTYLNDEQHQQVGSQLVAAAEGGIDGILVFDLEV
ncbi:MAG: Dabb family protein [Thiolinea sp.]